MAGGLITSPSWRFAHDGNLWGEEVLYSNNQTTRVGRRRAARRSVLLRGRGSSAGRRRPFWQVADTSCLTEPHSNLHTQNSSAAFSHLGPGSTFGRPPSRRCAVVVVVAVSFGSPAPADVAATRRGHGRGGGGKPPWASARLAPVRRSTNASASIHLSCEKIRWNLGLRPPRRFSRWRWRCGCGRDSWRRGCARANAAATRRLHATSLIWAVFVLG